MTSAGDCTCGRPARLLQLRQRGQHDPLIGARAVLDDRDRRRRRTPMPRQLLADAAESGHAHVERERLPLACERGPVEAFDGIATVGSDEAHGLRVIAMRERDAGVGAASDRGRDARHHLERAAACERLDLLAAAPEDERIAALQPDDLPCPAALARAAVRGCDPRDRMPAGDLPTQIRSASRRARFSTSAETSRSYRITSASCKARRVFSVNKPASPGPAPTSTTLPRRGTSPLCCNVRSVPPRPRRAGRCARGRPPVRAPRLRRSAARIHLGQVRLDAAAPPLQQAGQVPE